jgi:hypothetical protein
MADGGPSTGIIDGAKNCEVLLMESMCRPRNQNESPMKDTSCNATCNKMDNYINAKCRVLISFANTRTIGLRVRRDG